VYGRIIMNPEHIQNIVDKHRDQRGALIAILESIQSEYGYLPTEALKLVAEKTGRSLVDIYGVATFYRAFSLTPRGRHLVSVCQGTACHVRGAMRTEDEFERQLRIKPGETTSDREFTLETVNCLGACALGPIVVVDGHYFSNVTPKKVKGIIVKSREGLDRIEIDADERVFPLTVSCSRCNHTLMDSGYLVDGYPSIRVTMSFGNKHGWLRLSSLYGSFNVESEYPIPMNTLVHFFCPHCHSELIGPSNCTECGAPMVQMIVSNGGIVTICSRRGCKGHMLDVDGVNI
jgi:NADH-quinone oxidoreductase subunit E